MKYLTIIFVSVTTTGFIYADEPIGLAGYVKDAFGSPVYQATIRGKPYDQENESGYTTSEGDGYYVLNDASTDPIDNYGDYWSYAEKNEMYSEEGYTFDASEWNPGKDFKLTESQPPPDPRR